MKVKLLFICLLIITFSGFAQDTSIPDSNFEQALIDLGIDTNPIIDGVVPTVNINGVTSLGVASKNITDLTGIEGFTALISLYCDRNQLTSLDVSANSALVSLYCDRNQLPNLDVSANIALKTLACQENQLTGLDLSTNTALTRLYCYINQLTSLDIAPNTTLTDLRCFSNQLTSLNVSTNIALTRLYCYDNELTSLDVRNANNLNFAYFYANTNPNLTCIFVDDVAWSTTNWTNIDATSTFVNNETECMALSVEDNTFGTSFNVYPNPSFGLSKIQLGENYNKVSVNVFNVLGKQVVSLEYNSTNEIELNTQEYSTGIYFIKVKSGAKEATIKLVVK